MGWNAEPASASPFFEPLRIHGGAAFGLASPGLEDFQRLLDSREPPVRVACGLPLRVVPQARKPSAFEDGYEARIRLRGELQVRPENRHDAFNVLAWLAFPRSKAALNARHYEALLARRASGAANRGPVQDALTLFDESGVIVASADEDLLALLRAFRWKELFWAHRERVQARMRFWIFGHALCEKALRPFIGMTGRAVLLKSDLAALAPREQLEAADTGVAAFLSDPAALAGTRDLAVVPVLGVPGWWAGNESEAFYDDTDHFRPGRLKDR